MSNAPAPPEAAQELPFFRFGQGTLPLALIGGGLILDSGEAENTFVFRCQDRFLVYTSLLGLRSVVLVLDEAHQSRCQRLMRVLNQRVQSLAEVHGLAARRMPEPLYVHCDIRTLSLAPNEAFNRAAGAMAAGGGCVFFLANQVSATAAHMLGELTALLQSRGVRVDFDGAGCERVASLAMAWHNKARFIDFQREARVQGGPPQVCSMVLDAEDFIALPDWGALAERFAEAGGLREPPTELFLKSSQDSSGNVSAILSAQNFAQRAPGFAAEVRRWLLAEGFDEPRFVQELRTECELPPSLEQALFDDATLAGLRSAQASRRTHLPLIVQPVVRPSPAAPEHRASLGVSLFIDEDGACRTVAIAAQLYRDAERRQFLGLLLDDDLLRDPQAHELSVQCQAMAAAMAARGYRGPVNFDACLGTDGRYWFVGDCNPRLTALYVPLAVRSWLRSCGVAVRSVIGLGYRGEFVIPDVPRCLDLWTRAGLLFTRRRPQGLLVLPNIARCDGHDALAINLSVAETSRALECMRQLAADSVPVQLQSIHG